MARVKKRRIGVASLLASLHLGLGFLYVGRPWLAVAMPLAPVALLVLGRLSGLVLMPWGMIAFLALLIGTWLGGIVWCGFAARRAGEVTLAPYQRWYVYIGYSVGISMLFFFYTHSKVQLDWVGARPYRIPSTSMSDTLRLGDYVIADSWAYLWGRKPRRGDIVVFVFPAHPDLRYAKRIIGLPGERVERRDGRVYVDEIQLDEPYINPSNNVKTTDSWRYAVPMDSYFLLGDNRDHSDDSRYEGYVPSRNIFGRVRAIWLSFEANSAGLHFDRVKTVM